MPDRPRVIIALPDVAEGAAVADWLLADGLDPVRRSTPQGAVDEMRVRPFDLLIADAVFAVRSGLHTQGRVRNPLTPTILVGDASSPLKNEAVSRQAMYLTRPIDRAVLACFVSMAILDGRPIRRSERKSVHRFEALVNGVPSHIVDVSAEGVRLEVPCERRKVLPPFFTVRVPLVGVAVIVHRRWTHPSSSRTTLWYGGALSRNRASVSQAWKSFADTIPVAEEPVPPANPSSATLT